MAAPASPHEIRDVNVRYHDAAASDYDAKWGIDFHEVGRAQVLGKLRKALGQRALPRYERALEIGAGTGYFSLHLVAAGVVDRATCTDISPGMLETLAGNAERLGIGERVETRVADAEELPFADASFDLVLGHAVLHHLPDLERAFTEFARVLRPSGTLTFAGEPSRHGDRLAGLPKAGGAALAPAWRAIMGARRAAKANGGGARGAAANGRDHRPADGVELEAHVDVHTFTPGQLRALAFRAGFEDVRVRGEELLASWFGWTNRTLEATAEPDSVPVLWRQYAYRGYLAMQALDRALLEPHLPAAAFYNLMLAARKPA
jgi:SAM-dependent methyltransferase